MEFEKEVDKKEVVKSVDNKVLEIYTVTVEATNIIDEMQKLDSSYFRNNWAVGLSNISYDIKHILGIMEETQFSFDYKQAMTFMSYLRIFDYLINKMTDDLVTYEEGIKFVDLIISNMEYASRPFVAFVCSRIRDLGLVSKIPHVLQSLYNKMKEEGIDKWKDTDLSNVFDFAFPDDDSMTDDTYIDEVKEEMSKMFGEGYNIEDFTRIGEILVEYTLNQSKEAVIELDF